MAQTSSGHVFTLTTETVNVPLVVTSEALADFRDSGLSAMNECLAQISARESSSDATPPSNADLVADMLLEGLEADNTRKLILCALWMAHHHPDVRGLVRHGNRSYFVRDTAENREKAVS